MKYLKEITIEFGKIVDEEISIIKGENPSVEKITITILLIGLKKIMI